MLDTQELSNGIHLVHVSPLLANYNKQNPDQGQVVSEPGWYIAGEEVGYPSIQDAIVAAGLCSESEQSLRPL